MKILVIGGGIGGLAAAGFLERKGFEVTLVERAPEFKHIGFSMTIFPNGRRLLHELGIEHEVSKDGYEITWLEMIDTNGHIIGQKTNFEFFKKFGEPTIAIERAALHEALVVNLKNTDILLNTTVKKIKQDKDKVHVVLSNNSKHTFDLVIAADGIKSEVREKIFGPGQVTFYGWSLRFFWAPPHTPIPKGAVCLSKEKAVLALYPTRNKCCVAIYEYNPKQIDHPPIDLDSFLPYLMKHGWTKKHIEEIKKAAATGKQYYDHLKHVVPGDWYKGRVALLGDARHGISPLTGMGAGMALEDAFVLADELAKVDTSMVNIALANYAKRRKPNIDNILALSKFIERFFLIKTKPKRELMNIVSKFVDESYLMKKYEKIFNQPL